MGIAWSPKTGEKYVISCGKKDCPYCGKLIKNRLLDDISYCNSIVQAEGERLRFFTLTTSPRTNQDKFMTFYNNFWKLLKYHIPDLKDVRYMGVVELQKKIWYDQQNKAFRLKHIHGLVDRYIPQSVMQSVWQTVTGFTARGAYIKTTNLQSPAGYISKYIDKDLGEKGGIAGFSKGERRYNFSRNWPRLEKFKSDGEFQYVPLACAGYLGISMKTNIVYGDEKNDKILRNKNRRAGRQVLSGDYEQREERREG